MDTVRCATLLLSWLFGAAACRTEGSTTPPVPAATPQAVATAAPSASSVAASSCGALGCRLYESPVAAFAAVLGTQPRILAVGEAHAPQGSEAVLSATSRFAHALLPLLRGRMSDLVLELAVADGSCGARERQVAAAQKPVTARQASTNQDELVALRRRATELGARAHLLRPSCADYAEVARAGPDAIPRMLELVARLTATRVRALLSAAPSSSDRMVVTYGGAMHNDLVPRPGREKWSFGPELSALTSGRYVELDLVVPEYVRDNDSWRALEWYPYFSPAAHPGKTLLFNPRPGSYVLIFPRDGVQR